MAYFEYKPLKNIYHYCSFNAFKGIVDNSQLWLSDIEASNDPRELRLGYDWLIPILEEYKFRLFPSHRADFFRFVGQNIIPYLRATSFYCSCLSLAEDSLPMWAAYGDNYQGLSIGFRPTAVDGIPGRVQKVRYISDDTKLEFEKILFSVADKFSGRNISLHSLEDAVETVSAVVSAITSVKHSSWDYEKEVRILFAQCKLSPLERGDMRLNFSSEMPDGKIIPWQRPSRRPLATGAVPYLPFHFGKYDGGQWDARRAISKVIIGPKSGYTIKIIEDVIKKQDMLTLT